MQRRNMTLLAGILIITIASISGFCLTTNKNTNSNQNLNIPISSSTSVLSYNSYKYDNATATPNYNITWSFSSSNSNVSITVMAMNYGNFTLFNDSQLYNCTILSHGNSTVDNGTFSPKYSDMWYIVYLNNDSVKQSTDLSYNTKFLSPLPAITIISPTNSSSWAIDASYYIYWDSVGNITNVNITLYINGSFFSTIANHTNNIGSYYWELPQNLTPNSSYEILLMDSENSSVYSFSDDFIITPRNTLLITNPIQSVSWNGGSSYHIYWTTNGSISHVDIFLYLNGTYFQTIASNINNTGQYMWTIPAYLSSKGPFEIRIEDSTNENTYNVSGNFYIISQVKTQTTTQNPNPITNIFNVGPWVALGILVIIMVAIVFIGSRSNKDTKITQSGPKDEKSEITLKSAGVINKKPISKFENEVKTQNSNNISKAPILENICPRCGILVKPGIPFCPECGQLLIRDY